MDSIYIRMVSAITARYSRNLIGHSDTNSPWDTACVRLILFIFVRPVSRVYVWEFGCGLYTQKCRRHEQNILESLEERQESFSLSLYSAKQYALDSLWLVQHTQWSTSHIYALYMKTIRNWLLLIAVCDDRLQLSKTQWFFEVVVQTGSSRLQFALV